MILCSSPFLSICCLLCGCCFEQRLFICLDVVLSGTCGGLSFLGHMAGVLIHSAELTTFSSFLEFTCPLGITLLFGGHKIQESISLTSFQFLCLLGPPLFCAYTNKSVTQIQISLCLHFPEQSSFFIMKFSLLFKIKRNLKEK